MRTRDGKSTRSLTESYVYKPAEVLMPISLKRLVVHGAVLTAALVGISPEVRADNRSADQCSELDGPFSSTTDVPGCQSPVGLCTRGILGGPLRDATYDFTVLTLEPDPNDPSRMVATGVSVVTTQWGQMFTDDVSILQLTGPEPSDPVFFETTATITSGTRRWKHTTGEFIAEGILNFATGEAIGDYTALLCKDPPGHGPRHCN